MLAHFKSTTPHRFEVLFVEIQSFYTFLVFKTRQVFYMYRRVLIKQYFHYINKHMRHYVHVHLLNIISHLK